MATLHTLAKKSRLARKAAPEAVRVVPEPEAPALGEPIPSAFDRSDPWDVEGPPEGWPEDTDADVWADGPELADPDVSIELAPSPFRPIPDGDDDHAWNVLTHYQPTERERRECAEAFGAFDAQRHLDHGDRLTLAELADRQADFYRSWGNDAGEMFALAIDAVALQIRLTGATTPQELAARLEVLDEDAQEAWFEAGRKSVLPEPLTAGFGHDA